MEIELPQAFLDLKPTPAIPVGSRVTCNPPPTDTDADYLVYVMEEPVSLVPSEDEWTCLREGIRDKVCSTLMVAGWEFGGSEDPQWPIGSFDTFRKGIFNLIVAYDAGFHHRFLVATALAKRLNVMDKSDRIALFRAVREGEMC